VYKGKRISIVIPAYNEERLIIPTLMSVPKYIDLVFVVDDGSEDMTSNNVESYKKQDSRIKLIKLEKNRGVGFAIKTGYLTSIKYDIDIVAILSGDHQCDAEFLPFLLDPIVNDEADYTKGNRFLVDAKEIMPNKRYLGNIFLSILTRLASGNHSIFDTQNGFSAISRKVIETIDWDLCWDRYGYVSDFTVKLATYGFRIKDIPVRSIYIKGERQSQIIISNYIKIFFPMIFKAWLWRIKFQLKNWRNKIIK